MTIFLKDPASPESIAELKKRGEVLLEVTMTRLYILHGGDDTPLEQLMKDWFVRYRGCHHAYRDGSHVGGSDIVTQVKNLTDDGKIIQL